VFLAHADIEDDRGAEVARGEAPMPKQVAMNMPSAAPVTIPVSTKPRNPTAKANAHADSGTPPAG